MADAEITKRRSSADQSQLVSYVQATLTTTIVLFPTRRGNVLTASSAGACGFRGSKSWYASGVAAEKAAEAGGEVCRRFVKGIIWDVMPLFDAVSIRHFIRKH